MASQGRRHCGAPNNMASINPNFIRIPEMGSANPEELFVCPYDPIHRVAAKRFPYHLMKCRKNWIGKSMSTCPFNARHIVPQPEFRHHVANCPDKACIEQDMAYFQRKEGVDGSYTKGNTSIPAYNRNIPSPTEDWEKDIAAEPRMGYDPDDYMQQRPNVFMNLNGYTAGERREFHKSTGVFHFKTQEDFDTHVPSPLVTSQPLPRHPNSRTPSSSNSSSVQPQTTASSGTSQHMRLPKQPPKAAVVAAAAAEHVRDSAPSKRGGRIAANIFGSGLTHSQFISNTSAPKPVSTPLATSESHASIETNVYNGGLSNGVSKQTTSTSAFRPPAGMGRGLVPGLGRGIVPGIGRGLASYTGSLSFSTEPKVGLQQQ